MFCDSENPKVHFCHKSCTKNSKNLALMSINALKGDKKADFSDAKVDLDPLLDGSDTHRNYSTISRSNTNNYQRNINKQSTSGSTSVSVVASPPNVTSHVHDYHEESDDISNRIIKCFGRLLQYIQPYMGFVSKLYYALLFNVVFVSILFVIASIDKSNNNNGLLGYNIFKSNSPPLLVGANIIMMISYSIESYVILRVCLSCGCGLFCMWCLTNQPLLFDGFLFNLVMLMFNIRHAFMSLYKRRYIEFSPEYEQVYKDVFSPYLSRTLFEEFVCTSYVRYGKKDDIFYKQGDLINCLTIIVSGRVVVSRTRYENSTEYINVDKYVITVKNDPQNALRQHLNFVRQYEAPDEVLETIPDDMPSNTNNNNTNNNHIYHAYNDSSRSYRSSNRSSTKNSPKKNTPSINRKRKYRSRLDISKTKHKNKNQNKNKNKHREQKQNKQNNETILKTKSKQRNVNVNEDNHDQSVNSDHDDCKSLQDWKSSSSGSVASVNTINTTKTDGIDATVMKTLLNPQSININNKNEFLEAPQWMYAELNPAKMRFEFELKALDDVCYIYWPRETIVDLINKNHELYVALQAVLGVQTAQLLIRSRQFSEKRDEYTKLFAETSTRGRVSTATNGTVDTNTTVSTANHNTQSLIDTRQMNVIG